MTHRTPIHTSETTAQVASTSPVGPAPRPRPTAEPLLTPAEVAAAFRVDPKTVTRWARAGRISSVRTLGGHRRYRKSEVDALLRGGVGATARTAGSEDEGYGWAIRFTRPHDGSRAIRLCVDLDHARACIADLPDDYRPAEIIVGAGERWAPYVAPDGAA